MHKPLSLSLRALIAMVLAVSFVPAISLAWSPPVECPEGEALDPGSDACLPAEDGEQPDPAGTGHEEDPFLTLLIRLCPPEVAALDLEADLTAACAQPASGFTIEIVVDGRSAGSYATDASGELAVPRELGPGQYLFRLSRVPGLLELRTVCDAVYPGGSSASGRSQVSASDADEMYLTNDGVGVTTCTFFFIGGDAGEDVAGATPMAATPVVTGEGDAAAGADSHVFRLSGGHRSGQRSARPGAAVRGGIR